MNTAHSTLYLPLALIVVGTGWLLSTLGVVPEVDWIWTLGLAAIGVASIPLWGWNKVTCVVAPFFLSASVMSVLRQTGQMRADVEVPILTILCGVLALVAHHSAVPTPRWIEETGSSTVD